MASHVAVCHCARQDFDKTVVPITELKLLGLGIEGEFGTGFCLDATCRFIATNYHVAMMARPRKIKGEKIVQLYLATGPDDEGATVNDGPSVSPLKYTLSCDLAIFELRYSLPHHHSVPFSHSEGKPPPACLPSTTACPRTKPFIPARAAE